MTNNKQNILFGVDYYPEQWDPSLWEDDARRMAESGFRAARMMENAWAVIEPQKGHFDFSIFDRMIDIFARFDIKCVLGTPTATFPVWLFEEDPTLVQVHPGGIKKDFGTRNEGCFNAASYLEASFRMVKVLAEHFGNNPNVIGWQVDNEIGHEGTDRCVCVHCQRAWHEWLKQKYSTIKNLNANWGTVFWSTTYQDFHQVPVPKRQIQTIQNPGLTLDYDRFCSDSAVKFAIQQCNILRKFITPQQWISTNTYGLPHSSVIDFKRIFEKMDFPGASFYPVWGDADKPSPYYFMAYYLSYVRGLSKDGEFTVFEQFTNLQGHQSLGYLPPEKQVVLWTNQSIARGANKIFYFRWRTLPYGQEQLCNGILNPDNSDTKLLDSLRENIKIQSGELNRLNLKPYEATACLVYDKDNSRIIREQYLSKGLHFKPTEYMQVGYDLELTRHFAPFVLFNVNADVKRASDVDLSKYRVISLPLYQMVNEEFLTKLLHWVEDGGTLILGWRTGTRDERNWTINKVLPGSFSTLAGIEIPRFESLNETKVKVQIGWLPLKVTGEIWADLLTPITAKPLAWYKDSRKYYSSTPCVTVNQFGKGHVYYLGTSFSPLGIFFLYRHILRNAGEHPKFYGSGIELIDRYTQVGAKVEFILNHNSGTKLFRGKKIPGYSMWIKSNAKKSN